MSSQIVEVKKIEKVLPHPNADRLQIAVIGGWNVVIKMNEYAKGDLAVFIPPDYIVPKEVSDKFGFTKYTDKGRVRSAKLRGEVSHGVLVKPEDVKWKAGKDVADFYGITKYKPPFNPRQGGRGDQEKPHPLFDKYTEIENLRHHTDILIEGEEVVVTEKIHGTNSRIAVIDGEVMAGSKNHRRKMPMVEIRDNWFIELLRKVGIVRRPRAKQSDREKWKLDWFWSPWVDTRVVDMMEYYGKRHKVIIAYGETFGGNVQKGVSYGSPESLSYRMFDMKVDGKYLDYDTLEKYAFYSGVGLAPVLYRGPYSLDKIIELSKGKTVVNSGEDRHSRLYHSVGAQVNHIREGVVVRPVKERYHPEIGRVILKYVSDDYLLAKDTGDFGDEDADES